MKKTKWTLVLALMVLTTFSLSAQKPADLVGTWEGEGTLEGIPNSNVLTLVLKLEDGELVGHMTDQYGSMAEAPIDEVRLGEGSFSFTVGVDMGSGQVLMTLSMKVEGDSMEGKIEIPDEGMAGTWEATKQK